MNLASPITITIPGYTRNRDGKVVPPADLVVDALGITIIDDVARKLVHVRLMGMKNNRPVCPIRQSLQLWNNESYDAAGDYTQADVEARLLELLGPDIKVGLEGLLVTRPVS